MAIEFDCPHCGHHYRLKDDLAGKAAACKNCRNKITIPTPVTVPDDTPPPAPPVDVEAAALAALADAAKAEEDPSKKLIEVECQFCSHKWTEPLTRAGKNTLCPNPECRQRVKIPEPKNEEYHWQQVRTKGPSLAKDNQQKLEGVQATEQAKQVSGEALKQAGVIKEELEPRPLRQKVMFVLVPLALLAGLVFGVLYLMRSGKEDREDKVMANAQKDFASSEFVKVTPSTPKEMRDELPVFTAVMHVAGGEHALRHNNEKKLKEAMKEFSDALAAIRPGTSPARNAAAAELALALLDLGGTEEQARDQIRIRWTPDRDLKIRPNEQLITVYGQLTTVLSLLQVSADLDFRTQLARRLTRELAKRGQPGIAAELIPLALFKDEEVYEAKAIVALELHRAQVPDLPAKIAKELATDMSKSSFKLGEVSSKLPSVQTLFTVLSTPNAPKVVSAPPPAGPVPNDARFAYTGVALLQSTPSEALALAQRDGKAEDRLRALVLCADWLPDPGPALDAAYVIVDARNRSPKEPRLSPYAILRLAQIASATGKHDLAKNFAEALPDDSSKAWAKGDSLRLRLANAPNDKGEESWMELPDKQDKYRAGHAWGQMWLARHNTRAFGNRSEQVKAVSAWKSPLDAFGKAGVALGLQDREK